MSKCAVIITLLLAHLIPYENQLSGKVNFINIINVIPFIPVTLNSAPNTIYGIEIHYKIHMIQGQSHNDVLENGI